MATLGEYMIKLLEQYGVELVFGIPGVHTVELYRGLDASPIRHVTPRHEQGAGFMADGYARVTGKPGVCLVITGPGLSNIATAMLQAKADSVPMLVISGVNRTGDMGSGRGCLHEMPDQGAFAKQIAVFSRTILRPEELPEAIARAFAQFDGGRPGPVHVEIPLDLMSVSAAALPPPRRAPQATSPAAAPLALAAMVAACETARRPVIILGGGGLRAGREAVELAERLDCPLIPTINARGAIPLGHPLSVPASGCFDCIRDFIDDSDLALAFGSELGPTDFDQDASGMSIAPPRLIRVDIDPQQLARGPKTEIAVAADAKTTLSQLLAALPDIPEGRDGAARAARARKAAWAELPQDYRDHIALLDRIRALAPEAILVGDSTQLVYAGNMYFDSGDQGGWFNSSVGFGTLGYALPAALGAKLGAPDKPVVSLLGDGGAQFTLGELGAISDSGLPVVTVVWNNDGYGQIRSHMIEAQVRPEGVELTAPDFAMIARAYGQVGVVVDKAADLPEAVAAAIASGGATVIEVRGM